MQYIGISIYMVSGWTIRYLFISKTVNESGIVRGWIAKGWIVKRPGSGHEAKNGSARVERLARHAS